MDGITYEIMLYTVCASIPVNCINDNNKIKNANIAERLEINDDQSVKKSFYEKHPVICGFLISLVAGIVLLFSFWDRIVNLIEGVF